MDFCCNVIESYNLYVESFFEKGGPPRIAVRHQSLYIPWMMRSLGKMVTASVQGKFRQVSQRFVRWQLVRSVVFRFESWGSTESASITSLQLSICFNDTRQGGGSGRWPRAFTEKIGGLMGCPGCSKVTLFTFEGHGFALKNS